MCERCKKAKNIQGERFCGSCKHRVLVDMERSGYFKSSNEEQAAERSAKMRDVGRANKGQPPVVG